MNERRPSEPTRLPFLVHRCVRAAGDVLERAGVRGEPVLVAVSGGGDSMALLEIASVLAPRRRLELHVASIDHGLRATAGHELALVREAALAHGAKFHAAAIDPGAGDEDTLRRARHRALGRMARENGCRWILLGHTSDDQVETMLFRFLRGAGFGGLAGMCEIRPPLLRPLLSLRREDLRDLLRSRSADWIEDESNLSPRYARGRLRSVVLPAIIDSFGTGALQHLLDLAPRWRADEEYLEKEAARLLAYASRRSAMGTALDVAAITGAHAALRSRALRSWMRSETGHGPSSREIASVERWLLQQARRNRMSGRGGIDIAASRLVMSGGRLEIHRRDDGTPAPHPDDAAASGARAISIDGQPSRKTESFTIDIPAPSDEACIEDAGSAEESGTRAR